MSTHAFIGLQMPDGKVRYIYCHSDGYVEHTGVTLQEHYTDRAKVEELIALGDISWLGKDIGEKHNFEERKPEWVRAYHRDRGEDLNPPEVVMTRGAFFAADGGAEYWYMFNTIGHWWMRDRSSIEPQLLMNVIAEAKSSQPAAPTADSPQS